MKLEALRELQVKALANRSRRDVLGWLAEPGCHFAHQGSGSPEELGVCVTLLAERLGASQPTMSRHLELLHRAGLVRATRVGRWTFYARDETALDDLKGWLGEL